MNESKGRPAAAAVLIGLGVFFLAAQIFDLGFFFGWLWPFFIIIPGAIFLYFAYTGGKNQAGLAIPGAIITGTGAILFYQNMTNHWESWAYAWTLYPLFVGLGLGFMSRRTGDEGTRKASETLIRIGGFAFIGFAALFELFLFGRGGIFSNLFLPIVLIGAGLFMLMRKNAAVAVGGYGHKAKIDDLRDVLSSNGKSKNGYGHLRGDRLQQEIDAALTEDDDPEAKPPTV